MKYILVIGITILFSACMAPREITEQYIKNKIEKHEVGKANNSLTYTIFKGFALDHSSYLEITGFKQGSEKKMVIGVDKYYNLRPRFSAEQAVLAEVYYLELDMSEFVLFYNELINLKEKASSQTAGKNETSYMDITITPNFFISSSKYNTTSPGMFNVNLWINGDKYVIPTNVLINQLEKFKSWNP
jgi:hypothetical protein